MLHQLRRHTLGAVAATCILGTSAVAQADPYTHDGFYLRTSLAFGHGSLSERLSVPPSSVEASFKGFTTMFELLLGGTPAPGW